MLVFRCFLDVFLEQKINEQVFYCMLDESGDCSVLFLEIDLSRSGREIKLYKKLQGSVWILI